MADQTCMVCGKEFGAEQAMKWMHDGKWYAFDDLGCRNRFIGNPDKFLQAASS
jgi:YHS domain-containing protein